MTSTTGDGTRLYVSATLPAAYDQSSYEALTFTEVGEIDSLGDISISNAVVERTPLNGGTRIAPGTDNAVSTSPTISWDKDDAGQAIMRTAKNSKTRVSMRADLPDGTQFYFESLVSSFGVGVTGANDTITAPCTLNFESRSYVVVTP